MILELRHAGQRQHRHRPSDPRCLHPRQRPRDGLEFEGEVLEYDPPIRSVILMQGRMFDIRVAYEFEDLDHGRTRVNQCSASTGKGLWRLLLVVLQPLTRKSVAKATSGTPASPGGPTRG